MTATRPLCIVCSEVPGKYKCPRCELFTCSVDCSRVHRDNHPAVEPKPKPAAAAAKPEEPKEPRESGVKQPAQLSNIVDTEEYKDLLRRYPDLEKYLWDIATATDPPNPARAGPKQQRKPNQPWTQEVGMDNAVRLVQSIKASPGNVRSALREFSDLVSIFKAKMQTQEDQLRKERAQHDAHVISSLLRNEKS
ncbi:hypothetical protein F5Y17DRAFT_343329 [Xylariaceae sp. FL0594]|nr:hypothetical protein F5Y17DRAFT_343329 [Xylariaceae sp. FL0594]